MWLCLMTAGPSESHHPGYGLSIAWQICHVGHGHWADSKRHAGHSVSMKRSWMFLELLGPHKLARSNHEPLEHTLTNSNEQPALMSHQPLPLLMSVAFAFYSEANKKQISF